MALSTDKIDSIRNTTSTSANIPSINTNVVSDLEQNVSAAVQDPFGSIISKVLSKIGTLTSSVEDKVDKLAKDIVKSADSTGRVSLEGSNIVVTVTPEEFDEAQNIKSNIDGKIAAIKKYLVLLEQTLKTLNAVQTAISTLDVALTIQETLLSTNPASGPMYNIVKKGIKLIFLKEIIKQYSNILKRQLKNNEKKLSEISERFKNLQVSVVVEDQKNKGKEISYQEAEAVISQNLLNQGAGNTRSGVSNISEEYTDYSQNVYDLKVEKYDDSRIIARAYDKESGALKQQTSPSFFYSPQELLEELKTILNTD
jgi:hypothetical protein